MTSYECFRIEKSSPIATVYLANEKKRNAMGPVFWDELPRVFAELDRDDELRALVLAADGPVWTAGLDLLRMMPRIQGSVPGRIPQQKQLAALIKELQAAISSVERTAKPVIAAVHGPCIGGGVDLITACDLRLCSADATFSVREVRVAIVADLGTLQRLPRIVGEGHARELALTGDDIGADHALRIGLVNRVLPDRQATVQAAQALARRIAENSPLAVQGTKDVMNYSSGRTVQEGLDYVALKNLAFLLSDDLAEAAAAFMEKRPAVYKGT